ncbi:energy transducer TonB [Spirosoma flavum]|uniref:Energy transducer TonB n=1 Tax=Spirosoma flavum TaxID=2048557 RepID=A0ABW6AT37_9BACT
MASKVPLESASELSQKRLSTVQPSIFSMKFTFLALFLLLAETSFCQSVTDSLLLRDNQDFLMYTQRNVQFPQNAIRKGATAKVYVGFKLDEQGMIQDIIVLNPQPTSYTFEKEIIATFKRLPKQASSYQGDYALVYSFGYRNEPENSVLATSLDQKLIGHRQLLPEVKLSVSVSRPQRQASIANMFQLSSN